MQITAGTELSQQARPPWTIQRGIQSWQERMIDHFQNFPFYPRPIFFVSTHELFLVHDFSGEQAAGGCVLELHEVYAADVAASEAVDEAEIA